MKALFTVLILVLVCYIFGQYTTVEIDWLGSRLDYSRNGAGVAANPISKIVEYYSKHSRARSAGMQRYHLAKACALYANFEKLTCLQAGVAFPDTTEASYNEAMLTQIRKWYSQDQKSKAKGQNSSKVGK